MGILHCQRLVMKLRNKNLITNIPPSKSPPKNETPIFLKILKPAFLSDLQNLVLVDLAHWKKTNLKESVTSTTVMFVLT